MLSAFLKFIFFKTKYTLTTKVTKNNKKDKDNIHFKRNIYPNPSRINPKTTARLKFTFTLVDLSCMVIIYEITNI